MIMLAKVVPYGGNAIRYALEKENSKMVKANHMPEGMDPTAIWYKMKHHCQLYEGDRTVGRKLERFMVTFVLSPSKEESEDFTMDDWAALQDESLEVLDSLGIVPKGKDKKVKTNFSNSMNVGALHSDSKSGTLHLHIDCCRVDLDGKTNDVHDIHVRAMKAAEIINMGHGWKQPQEIRDMRKQEVADFCESTLRDMDYFDVNRYFALLRIRGYDVKPRYDRNDNLVGYTVGKNASVFKASEIGRKFMASKLESTWKKLHAEPTQGKTAQGSSDDFIIKQSSRAGEQTPGFAPSKVQTKPTPSFTIFSINSGTEIHKIQIPDSVKDILLNEAQIPEDNNTATTENFSHVAMLLFVGYLDAATSMSESCGGGGSAPESGWGKKDDEDERMFARRCLRQAHSMCKPRQRSFHR